jgi:hypothetical protein
MAINKTNGYKLDHYTAKELMLMVVEGVQVWATDAQWRRIYKRAGKLGLRIPDQHTLVLVDYLTEVNWVIYAADLMPEVDAFLEDMYIMGMLEEDNEDNEEED